MKNKADDNMLNSHDGALRLAAERFERRSPHAPAGLDERLMRRVELRNGRLRRFRWMSAVAAVVVAVAACGLTWSLKPHFRTPLRRHMSAYVEELVRDYGATGMQLDGAGREGVIYVFPDDGQNDVMACLKRVAMWTDPDDPVVCYVCSSDQMTLMLKGGKGGDEVWMADRMAGRVFLCHVRVEGENYSALACYTDFLDGIYR